MDKNKEMKDNIKKFRAEAQKLEQSDALQSARQKFNTVESEATKTGDVLKERLSTIKDKMHDVLEEASKSEIGKKASEMGKIIQELKYVIQSDQITNFFFFLGEEFSKSAKGVGSTFAETGQKIGSSTAFQSISSASKMVRKEMDSQGIQGRVYRSPEKLRKRVEIISNQKEFEANTEDLGIELHKDSKFYESWQNFKNNNQYVNKVLDWKIKYEESENPVIRASRLLTDKVSDIMGNVFSKTELSETMTEICKIDPNFDPKEFLKDCENDIIPNILEAMVRGNLEILKDWCFESTFNIISTPISQAQKAGYYLDSKILDIENVDLAMGKVMEQGPVLIITFQTQQIMCVRDKHKMVVEGDPEKIMRVNYVWVLCRDPNEMIPKSAWRLMDISANSSEQFV